MGRPIEQYRLMLPVMKHRLDDELEMQPQIMDEIVREVTIRNSRMIEAKDDLARAEARLADDIKDDEPKLAAAGVEGRVKRDPERIKAWRAYQHARSEFEDWTGLLDCWRQKGYSIKTLADLYAAQYFSLDSHQSRPKHPGRRDFDEAAIDEARRAIRTAGVNRDNLKSSEPEDKPTRRRTVL